MGTLRTFLERFWPAVMAALAAVVAVAAALVAAPQPIGAMTDRPGLIIDLMIAAVALSWLFLVFRAGLERRVQWTVFAGLGMYSAAQVMDVLDRLQTDPQPMVVTVASALVLTGLGLTTLGLWAWQRGNRRAFGVLAQSRRRYDHLNVLDAMTGLYNRGHFNRVWEESAARGDPGSQGLLIFDIDHFKAHNERYGHLAADRLITALGRCVESGIDRQDQVFRYGGDQFAVLTRDRDASGLRQLAERIRKTFQDERFHSDGRLRHRTASVGGAVLQPGEDQAACLRRAELSLNQAKSQGRNGVVIDAGD